MPKLTPKQQRFVSKYIKYGNATKAALETLDVATEESARSSGSRMLTNVNVHNKIQEICERRGLTENWAVRILKKQGKATRPLVLGKPGDESVEYIPDNPARQAAAETALKLHGHLKSGVNIQNNTQTLSVGINAPEDIAKLSQIVADLKMLRAPSAKDQQTGEIIDIDKYKID